MVKLASAWFVNNIYCFSLFCLFLIFNLTSQNWARDYEVNVASFQVKFRDEISSQRIIAIFVLPQEKLKLQVVGDNYSNLYKLKANSGEVTSLKKDQWIWQSPSGPGFYPITIIQFPQQDSIRLHIFVMVPFDQMKHGYLNECLIGEYPPIHVSYSKNYAIPSGFIEVTEDNENVYISPHFQLKQFICKQHSAYPKYIVLQERLLLKLELILEKLNGAGFHCSTLTIMSGYRTPHYNKAIGNVKLSRHIFGQAADFYIDEFPCDGVMDDLNRDGNINIHDAKIISNLIDSISQKPEYKPFIGGLAIYEKTGSHGPFVHIDVRGYRAKW